MKKLRRFSFKSFRRKPESRVFKALAFDWTPVFTGVTTEFQFLHTFRGFMGRVGFDWALGFIFLILFFSGCSGTRPSNLGVKDNRLSPCPSSPNCVSSQSDDEKHKIDPIRFTSTPAEAMDRLKKVILGMKRTTVVREEQDYLHVEFRTFLGFVDDGEFLVNGSRQVIHLRSASRVGYWDLGMNRKRMESIRAEFGRK